MPGIDKLAERKLQLTLSVSLHAPDNVTRSSMMPVNDAFPLEKLIPACRRYQKTTGRRISFEYSMVNGVNDSPQMAKKLADLIRGMGAHVNLIPINPVDGSPYSATDEANVRRFQKMLEDLGVNATIRRRLVPISALPAASSGAKMPNRPNKQHGKRRAKGPTHNENCSSNRYWQLPPGKPG